VSGHFASFAHLTCRANVCYLIQSGAHASPRDVFRLYHLTSIVLVDICPAGWIRGMEGTISLKSGYKRFIQTICPFVDSTLLDSYYPTFSHKQPH